MEDFPLEWATDGGGVGGVPIPRAQMMASQLHGSSRGLLQSSSSLSTSHQYLPDHSTSHSPYLHQSLSPAGSLNQNYQEHSSPAAVQFSQQSGGAGHTPSSACYSSPTDNSNNMYGGGTGLSPHPPPQSPSPHMWQTQFMDLDGDDLDIKIEPFELLGMDGGNNSAINNSLLTDFSMDGINSSFGAPGNGGQDDNSFLGVGSGSRLFQDSCYPDDLISGSDTTTCLDPQHSSPAAMAVVRPDEVLGIGHHHHHGNSGPGTASAGSSVTNSFSQMLLQPNNSISSNSSSSGQRQQQNVLLQQQHNHQQTLQLNNLLQQHQQQQQQQQHQLQQHQQQMSHSFTSNSFLSSQMLDDINNSRGQGGGGFSTSVSGGSLSLMQPQHQSPIKVEPNSGDLPSSFSPPCSAWPDAEPSSNNLLASSSLPTNAYGLLLEASSRAGEQVFGSALGQLSHEQLLMQELFERDIEQGSPLLQVLDGGDEAMMDQGPPQQQQQQMLSQQQQQVQLQKQLHQEQLEHQLRQHLHHQQQQQQQQQQQHQQQQQDLIQRQANPPQRTQNPRPVSTQQIHNSQKQVMQLHRQLQQQAQRRQLAVAQQKQQQQQQQHEQQQQQQHQKRITSQQQDIPGRENFFDSSPFPLTPNNTPVQSSFCIPSTLKEMLMQSPSTSLSSPISPQSACSPVSACSPLPMSSPCHNAPSPITVQSSCQDESLSFGPLSNTVPSNAVMSPQHFSPSPTPQQQPPQSVSPQYILSTSSPNVARLSSSAPALSILDQIWKRREPRKHLLSTGSLAEEQSLIGGSTSSLTNSILSPAPNELSIDESGLDSDEESEIENYDSDSDTESIMTLDPSSIAGPSSGGGSSSSTSATTSGRGGASSSSKERHFWQYNVQAKGPKGQRVSLEPHLSDPHQLLTVADPVFSSTVCSLQGIKHSGKARRGDGNDLNPNPAKLVSIGRQLSSLNKDIMEMTPVSEQPFHIRPKSRKEKNKLASRACRLKKKAQHEANKIKLFGLGEEHKALLQQVQQCRALLYKKAKLAQTGSAGEGGGGEASNADTLQVMLTDHITALVTNKSFQIAGQTADFVNSVIEMCRQGRSNGGLDDLARRLDSLRTPSSHQPPPTAGDEGGGSGSVHISSRDYMADFE